MVGVDTGIAGRPFPNGGLAREPPGPALISGLILAGGGARRLSGVDKPMLALGSSTILWRIIAVLAVSGSPSAPTATRRGSRTMSYRLRPGARHVGRFAATIGMRQVDFPPSTWDSFLNVNTQSDLEIARSRAAGVREGDQASGQRPA
jgi:molybdopterin-guanine dinucleotide biosynthesis protein A